MGKQREFVGFFSLFVRKISPFVKKDVLISAEKTNLQSFIFKIGVTTGAHEGKRALWSRPKNTSKMNKNNKL